MFSQKPKRGAVKRKRKAQAIIPSWLWQLLALSFGLFCFMLLLLWQPWQPANREEQQVGLSDIRPILNEKDDYQFYQKLPQQQVNTDVISSQSTQITPQAEVVDDAISSGTAIIENTSSYALNATPVEQSFALQVKSFQDPDMADDLKNNLLAMGLKVDVKLNRYGNGELWYRVIVGPFTHRSEADAAKKILTKHNVDSILIH